MVFLAKVLEIKKLANFKHGIGKGRIEGSGTCLSGTKTNKAAPDLGLHFNDSKHIDCVIMFVC